MKDIPSSVYQVFPISRDPPEGGTSQYWEELNMLSFPISRDPPEGGTVKPPFRVEKQHPGEVSNF